MGWKALTRAHRNTAADCIWTSPLFLVADNQRAYRRTPPGPVSIATGGMNCQRNNSELSTLEFGTRLSIFFKIATVANGSAHRAAAQRTLPPATQQHPDGIESKSSLACVRAFLQLRLETTGSPRRRRFDAERHANSQSFHLPASSWAFTARLTVA